MSKSKEKMFPEYPLSSANCLLCSARDEEDRASDGEENRVKRRLVRPSHIIQIKTRVRSK